MRKWINLAEDFSRNQKTVVLPAGTILHHGTDGDWAKDSHIRGPAWFGDDDMAEDYTNVMGHDNPVVLTYETTIPLRLLDVSEDTLGSRELTAMWDEEVPPSDMAYACAEAGYDGWFERGGEIMILDTTSLKLVD